MVKNSTYLLGEPSVPVDVSNLIAAEVFGDISAERAAVLGDAAVGAAVVLGLVVVIVIATVVLGRYRVTLEHGVELSGTFQRRNTVTPSGKV